MQRCAAKMSMVGREEKVREPIRRSGRYVGDVRQCRQGKGLITLLIIVLVLLLVLLLGGEGYYRARRR